MDVLSEAFHDIGLNGVVETLFITIRSSDIVPPKILHANIIQYRNIGSNVRRSTRFHGILAGQHFKFFLSNNAEDKFIDIEASIVESDGLHVTVILSERERVDAIAISESKLKAVMEIRCCWIC